MYPSAKPTRDAAAERRPTASGLDRDGFRPVALPALAAAVQASGTAKPDPRKAVSTLDADRFLHEDAPQV